jgi:hypothetical protein
MVTQRPHERGRERALLLRVCRGPKRGENGWRFNIAAETTYKTSRTKQTGLRLTWSNYRGDVLCLFNSLLLSRSLEGCAILRYCQNSRPGRIIVQTLLQIWIKSDISLCDYLVQSDEWAYLCRKALCEAQNRLLQLGLQILAQLTLSVNLREHL